jgi:LPXTG-motif cell wall-anchored protein
VSSEGRTARRALLAGSGAALAALAAAAASGATATPSDPALNPEANAAPVASLRLKHHRVRVGKKLLLDASASRDPDGRIVTYLWDLNGDGTFERNTGSRPRVRHAFRRARKLRVGLVVVDDRGAYDVTRARVRAVPKRAGESIGSARGAHPQAWAAKRATRVHRAKNEHSKKAAKRTKRTRRATKLATTTASASPAVTVASSAAVTIKSFKFAPKSLTIKVGDTVNWTNQDSVQHSATADNGTFDTGLIAKGSTRAYRFTTAGTYGYHCTPHPGMKATITVTSASNGSGGSGSGGSGSGNGSSGGTGSNNNTSSGSSSTGSLPHTGLEIGAVVLAGLALLGTGALLRRRLAGR